MNLLLFGRLDAARDYRKSHYERQNEKKETKKDKNCREMNIDSSIPLEWHERDWIICSPQSQNDEETG